MEKAHIATYRLIQLLPNSDRLVVRTGYDEAAMVADSQCPNFTMVSL
jgi:hypothetical protein